MNRDELLTKLAMELGEWPQDLPGPNLPGLWSCHHVWRCHAIGDRKAIFEQDWLQRRTGLINKPDWDDAPEWAEWLAQDEDGHWHWYDAKPDSFDRQWDSNLGDRVSRAGPGSIPAGHDWRETLERRPAFNESRADIIGQNGNDGDHYETSTYCDRCGGEYWTPPHEYCPCLDGVGSGKQSRYQDHSGDDWIDEFARTATAEEFRGAMRLTIGKYNRRMGRKDEIAQEVRKMRDYCDRWLAYEEGQ